jgi:hypothetical protein
MQTYEGRGLTYRSQMVHTSNQRRRLILSSSFKSSCRTYAISHDPNTGIPRQYFFRMGYKFRISELATRISRLNAAEKAQLTRLCSDRVCDHFVTHSAFLCQIGISQPSGSNVHSLSRIPFPHPAAIFSAPGSRPMHSPGDALGDLGSLVRSYASINKVD